MYLRVAIMTLCILESLSASPAATQTQNTWDKIAHKQTTRLPKSTAVVRVHTRVSISQLLSKSSAVQSQLPGTGRRVAVGLNGDQQEIPNNNNFLQMTTKFVKVQTFLLFCVAFVQSYMRNTNLPDIPGNKTKMSLEFHWSWCQGFSRSTTDIYWSVAAAENEITCVTPRKGIQQQ